MILTDHSDVQLPEFSVKSIFFSISHEYFLVSRIIAQWVQVEWCQYRESQYWHLCTQIATGLQITNAKHIGWNMQTKICRKISQTGMKCWDTKHSFVVPNLMLLTNLLALRTHMWTQMHEVSSLLPCLPHGSFCHGNEALIDERWGYSEWCFCPQFTVQYTCVDVRIRGQYPLYRRFFSPPTLFFPNYQRTLFKQIFDLCKSKTEKPT